MEPGLRSGIRPVWAALAAFILSLPHSVSAAEDAADDVFTRDSTDKQACEANLNFIFGAIREWRKQHQNKFPDKLSDLNPQYIHDLKMLICPYVQRTGGLRQWRNHIRELDFDPRTSYGYEFPQKEMPDNLWRGLPKKTWRDYKERQVEELGKLGSVVPVVRCHFHRPRLNLAFDGHIYESDLDWESNYTNVVSVEDLFPARLFSDPASRKKVAAADFPLRDSGALARLVDLSEHYNGLLTDAWQGFPSNHLAQLPSGLQELGGVPFDVRGVIQLRGMQVPFPEKIDGIRVNQKLSRIHFLHAAAFGVKPP